MPVSQSLALTQKSQNIENNTSTIGIKWTSTQSGASYNDYTCTGYYYVSVNGGSEERHSVSYTLPKSTTKTILDTTLTIPHNDEGKCSVTVRTWMDTDISAGVVELTKTLDLTPIARKSTLSASNGTLDTAQTLTVTRKSDNYTHTITYKCGSASGTICTKSSSTSISWTPPLSLASQNTTGTNVSVTFTIETFNGSTSIGSNTKTITCAIPSSVKPSCTLSVTDAMGYADTYGGYIKGKSKFKVIVSTTQSYNSPISSYSTTANGLTYTASSFTTGVIKTTGELEIKATVKDKRGRSGSASISVDVFDYSSPAIIKLAVKRCNSDGTDNDQGEYVKATFSSSVTSLDSANTASYILEYKKTSESSYTSVSLTDYDNTYSVTEATYVFAADSGSSYDIQLTVTDAFGSIQKKTSVSTGFTLFNVPSAFIGWAFGKVAELANTFEMAFESVFYKAVMIKAVLSIAMADGEPRIEFSREDKGISGKIYLQNSSMGSISFATSSSEDGTLTYVNTINEEGILPYATKTFNLGSSSKLWKDIYGTTLYEDGTALSSKYNPLVSVTNRNSTSISDVTVSTATNTNLGNFTLAAGTWLVFVYVHFASNATGRRSAWLATSSTGSSMEGAALDNRAPVNGANTTCKIHCILAPSSSTKYYLNCYQNSGSSLTVQTRFTTVKLK